MVTRAIETLLLITKKGLATLHKRSPSCGLLHDDFDPSVFSASCRCAIARDRITFAVTGSREVGHPAIPQSLSGTVRTRIRKFLVRWILLLQRSFDRHIVRVPCDVHLLFGKIFKDAAHPLQ